MLESGPHGSGTAARTASGEGCRCDVCRAAGVRTGRRILRAVDPRPDDSLMGLMARSCHASHMRSTIALLSEGVPLGHAWMNLAARDDLDAGQLAWAARLPTHEVEERRYRPVAISPDLPGATFHGTTVAAYDLSLTPRRTAPSWLKEGRHHAAGHHGLLTHCPATGEMLVEACPRCGKRFPWTVPQLRRCAGCTLDLRSIAPTSITRGELQATSLMVDILDPDPERHLRAVRRLPAKLAGLDRGAVFELGWRIGSVLTGVGLGDRDRAKKLDADTRLDILKKGSRVLLGWPGSVREACSDTAKRDGAAGLRLVTDLRLVTRCQNSWPCHRPLLLDAIPGSAVSSISALKEAVPGSANALETQLALGVSQKVFERLRAADALPLIAGSGTINRHQVFDAAKLGHASALLSDRLELGAVSERIGISHDGVRQLCAQGELEPLEVELALIALKRAHVSRSSFDRLVGRLRSSASRDVPPDAIPLRRAMFAIGGREKPWGAVIGAMLAGDMPFYIPDAAAVRTSGLMVSRTAIHSMSGFTADPMPARSTSERMNGRDAEELLNVNPKHFQKALAEQLLPRASDGTFLRTTVLGIARSHITKSEIVMRWVTDGRKLPQPLKGRAGPTRLDVLGWRRCEVEAAMMDAATNKSSLPQRMGSAPASPATER